ncbi:MAG: lysophospholipid acyltransferase family protein [Planctomycetota bacterium]
MVFFSARCFGSKRIPRKGGVLIACTHQSYLDPFVVGFSCARPVRYLARSTLFKNKLFAKLIRYYGAFELQRGEADIAAIRKCTELLTKGEAVLMFPEGTRSRNGEIAKLLPGAFLIAKRAAVPIVPAVIEGAIKAYPRGVLLPRFYPIKILYGKPRYLHKDINSRTEAELLYKELNYLQKRLRRIK